MKKLLSLMGILAITTPATVSVISCTSQPERERERENTVSKTNDLYNSIKVLSSNRFKNSFYDFESIKTENIQNNKDEVDNIISRSNEMLKGRYLLDDEWEMEPSPKIFEFENNIDWNVKYNDDVEMTYMFSRMSIVKKLIKSFIYTNDNKYLNKAILIVKDFQKNQPININTITRNGGTWRTIDSAIRLDVLLLLSSVLQKNKMEYIWLNEFILLHFAFLQVSYDEWTVTSNWGVFQNIYLLKTILFFDNKYLNDNFKDAIVNRMYVNIYSQFNDDGIQIEQSTMYHNEALMTMSQIQYFMNLGILKNNDKFLNLYKKAHVYTLSDSDMNHNEYLLGDSDRFSIKRFIETANLFLGIQFTNYDYKYMNEDNNFNFSRSNEYKEKEAFENTINYFKKSGRIFYQDNKLKLGFYNSSNDKKGHGHGDLLHFNLDYDNKNFFVDSGRYTYKENGERVELKNMDHHNTIVINDDPVQKFKGSWGMSYEKAKNIITNVQQQENITTISGSYVDTINNSKIERNFIFENNKMIIKNSIESKKKANMYFILDPKVKVLLEDKTIKLINDGAEIDIKHDFEANNIEVVNSSFSDKYNEKEFTKKLLFKINENDLLHNNNLEFKFKKILEN